jgi:hypothetical protein
MYRDNEITRPIPIQKTLAGPMVEDWFDEADTVIIELPPVRKADPRVHNFVIDRAQRTVSMTRPDGGTTAANASGRRIRT